MELNLLKGKFTIAEIEAKHLVSDERLGKEPVPFGFQNKLWVELRNQFRPGDELWEFCSEQETWEQLMGIAGIALVRDGQVIATITTRMN